MLKKLFYLLRKKGVFFRNVHHVKTPDGAVIDYLRFGSGTPLVVILGMGDGFCSVKDYSPLLISYFRPYSKKHQVIIMSRRRPLYKHHSLSNLAEDYAYTFTKLGLSKFHLWGNSAGGILAQQIALEYTEFLYSLILSRTYGRASKRFKAMVQTMVGEARDGRFDRFIGSFTECSKAQKVLVKFNPLINLIYKKILYYGGERLFSILLNIIDVDNLDALKSLKCPILVITEDKDTLVYDDMQKELAMALPTATIFTHRNKRWGHFTIISSKKDYRKTILSFLEKVTLT